MSKKAIITCVFVICFATGMGTVAWRFTGSSAASSASWSGAFEDIKEFVERLIPGRGRSAANACINNLRQFDGAKQQWGLEYKKTTNDVPNWDDILPYLKLTSSGQIPPCTHGGKYSLGRLYENPRCSVMEHNMDLGVVMVVDQSGLPVTDAQVAVRTREAVICSAYTSTNGEAFLLSSPRSWETIRGTNSWSDGTKQIVAVRQGYDTERVALPNLYWPLKIILKKVP